MTILYLYKQYSIYSGASEGKKDGKRPLIQRYAQSEVIYLEIILSNSSAKPIYEQISSQIKAKVMSGELKTGDGLPGMRSLARSLHVSVITVQHAYEDLQKEGFIETVAGKGAFVAAQNKDFLREEQLRIAEGKLQEAADIGKTHGIELSRLIQILTLFYEED